MFQVFFKFDPNDNVIDLFVDHLMGETHNGFGICKR